MNDYPKLQKDIGQLIKDMGTRGKIQTQAGKSASGYVVLVNSVKEDRASTTEIHNTKTMYFQGNLTADPMPGDVVTVGKTQYAIISSENYTPDNKTNIAYRLEVTT